MGDYAVLVTPSAIDADVVDGTSSASAGPFPEGAHDHTRRKFIAWGSRLVIGAGVLLGRPLGFTPSTAEAYDYKCISFVFIQFSCWGPYSEAISQCRDALSGKTQYCQCICYAGPGKCSPLVFRAHANWSDSLCCCAT